MKKVKVYIEKGADEYSAYMDDTQLDYSCLGQGNTVDETIEDFRKCYQEMQKHFSDCGEPFEEVEFEYYYDIPSFLKEFAFAFSLAGLERITGVNQKQLGHYISGYRKPSRKTISRIEAGVHNFAKTLSAIKFA